MEEIAVANWQVKTRQDLAERGGRRAEAFSEAAAEMAIKGAVTAEEGKKEAHKEEREKKGAPATSRLNSLKKSIEEIERRGRRRIPALRRV